MGEPYNTNLAAEFHVLSLLHRLGADAALSLGNKKAVDITVVRAEGEAVTLDVKGVAGRDDWPADNVRVPDHDRHFLALVSFEGRIGDPERMPSVWVVPARELSPLLRTYRTRVVVWGRTPGRLEPVPARLASGAGARAAPPHAATDPARRGRYRLGSTDLIG
jgi:hypothetical protein